MWKIVFKGSLTFLRLRVVQLNTDFSKINSLKLLSEYNYSNFE